MNNIEEEKKPLLERFFDTDLNLTDNYDIVDYKGNDIEIELKCRNNFSTTYPTTMIGMNKIEYLMKLNKRGYVVFNFKDGMFYMLVNKENIEKCILNCSGGRTDRNTNEIKENGYCYIPKELLNKINFLIDFE
tara:strand:- start:165 stop:563 length:399 start_codon:yes stop_codon:yes gene_type:complete